jgi:hypothetical protein
MSTRPLIDKREQPQLMVHHRSRITGATARETRRLPRVFWCRIRMAAVPLWPELGCPGLGERGELELVCRRPRILVGQKEDCLGDPPGVGERLG